MYQTTSRHNADTGHTTLSYDSLDGQSFTTVKLSATEAHVLDMFVKRVEKHAFERGKKFVVQMVTDTLARS